jgi:hypothetical protein
VDAYRRVACDGCDRVGGEPVNGGWLLIVLGIVLAVGLRHGDAIVGGVGLVLLGAWILTVKEPVR